MVLNCGSHDPASASARQAAAALAEERRRDSKHLSTTTTLGGTAPSTRAWPKSHGRAHRLRWAASA